MRKATSAIITAWMVLVVGAFAWTSAAQAACAMAAPGTTASVAIGDTGRQMLIHWPAGYDATQPAPLVFLFHGSGGSGAGLLKGSGLAQTADANNFIVAAPDGGIAVDKGFVWNIPGVPTVTGKIPGPEDAAQAQRHDVEAPERAQP